MRQYRPSPSEIQKIHERHQAIMMAREFGLKLHPASESAHTHILLAANEHNKEDLARKLRLFAAAAQRQKQFGKLIYFDTDEILPLYEHSDYFPKAPRWAARVEIRPEFVRGELSPGHMGPAYAANPSLNLAKHVFPYFRDEVPGARQHRIVVEGNFLSKAEGRYFLEFSPERGHKTQVIATRLRLQYS